MNTKAQVLKDNQDKKTLINAVISRIGMDSVMDVVNHGIDGCFTGFIYYADTHKFAMRHRKAICAWLNDQAEDMGEDVVTMVSNFGVFRNSKMDKEDKQELYNYLGNGKCTQGTITNVMAWFAAAEVCRLFDN